MPAAKSRAPVRLSAEAQVFVVLRLACFEHASVVKDEVKERFGCDISLQALEHYDPDTRAGRSLSAKLKRLFVETRAAFIRDSSRIGIAHRNVRLRRLERVEAHLLGYARRYDDRGAHVVAAQMLDRVRAVSEQAAKEMGGVFTNHHVLETADPAGCIAELLGMSRDDVLAAMAPAAPQEPRTPSALRRTDFVTAQRRRSA